MGTSDTKPSIKIALILLLIAALSRFYGIWLWDLVDDEYFTATHAYERFKSFVNPAYYSLVVLLYEIFGREEWLSRLPALLLSMITMPVLYILCAKTFGRKAALFSVLIVIFSSWHLYFSQLARFYAGVFFFACIAYFYFYKAIYSPRLKHLIFALVASVLAMSFHVTAVFVPFSIAAAYFFIFLFYRKNEDEVVLNNIKLYLGLCIVFGLVAVPFLFGVLDRWVSTGQSWGYGAILIIPQLVKYIQIPIAIAALFGLLVLFTKNRIAALFFTCTILIPCLFLIAASSFMAVSPSYVFYILVPVVVLAGIACSECQRILSENKQFLLSYFPTALLLALLVPSFASHYLAKISLNFESAEAYVASELKAGDKVLSFIPGFEANSTSPYELLPFISFERDNGTEWSDALNNVLEEDENLWIVISSKRKPIARKLEHWLFCNAKLVWQDHAVRVDYEVDGYQVFLSSRKIAEASQLNNCAPG